MGLWNTIYRRSRKYRTGIILSGGGARGFAHVGILKALNESGIFPDVISGVSAGAIVGALYADGYTPDQIFEIFSGEKRFFNYAKPSVPGKGLFKTVGLRKSLSDHLKATTFEDLKLRLFVTATNISKGQVNYFESGDLLDKVLASAAIPVLFEPITIDGDLYVDGGVLDNFPETPLASKCRKLIGISLNPILPEEDFTTLLKIAERTFRISVSSNISSKTKKCDLIFEPDELGNYGLLDASSGSEIFELGYKTAIKILEKNP